MCSSIGLELGNCVMTLEGGIDKATSTVHEESASKHDALQRWTRLRHASSANCFVRHNIYSPWTRRIYSPGILSASLTYHAMPYSKTPSTFAMRGETT